VGLDKVDRNSAATGRVTDSKFEQGIHIAGFGIDKAASKKKLRTLLANRPHL
jgi:hypothetical protein